MILLNQMRRFFKQKNKGKKIMSSLKGYTIIETMIAVSLFVVVVITAMGTLLNANLLHQKSQDMRSIMDNLSFIMEDMSRNLRTGYNYRCIDNGNYSNNLTVARSCSSGGGVAFEATPSGSSTNPSDQWIYKIESIDGGITFNVSKSTNSGTTWVQLNPSEVVLQSFSGFSVLGAEPPLVGDNDTQQPFVSIKLVGKVILKNTFTPFSLQTTVSQRLIDIGN